MNEEEIKKGASELTWWHQIDLGYGIITPGVQDSPAKLKRLHFPESFAGKTVLDVGAWDGFFAFEAERRGAARVLAVDSTNHAWKKYGEGISRTGKEGFRFARRVLGSKVEDEAMEVDDICIERVGQFDIVLFLGIFYHVPFPLYCLSRVGFVTKELLIVETHVMNCQRQEPIMQFYPQGREDDTSNKWYPNPPCIEEMLKVFGFNRIERFTNRPNDNECRMTFHAYR